MKLGLIYNQTSITGSDVDFFVDRILKLKKWNAEVIVCPEFALNAGYPYGEEEARAVLSRIEKGGNMRNRLILPGTYLLKKGNYMFNVLPVFINNKLIFYHKKTKNDEGIIAKKNKLEYISGGGDDGKFMFNKRVVGVEICRDNAMGKLKDNGQVNLQILVDCGSQYPKANALVSGGYFLICSGFNDNQFGNKAYAEVLDSRGKSLAYARGRGILKYEIK